MRFLSLGLIFTVLLVFCDEISGGNPSEKQSSGGKVLKLEIKERLPAIQIKIGSKDYTVILTTSYNGIWVMEHTSITSRLPRLHSGNNAKSGKTDDPKSSSTKLGDFEIVRLDGTVKGHFAEKIVVVGDKDLGKKQIGIVTYLDESFKKKMNSMSIQGYFGILFSGDMDILKSLLQAYPKKTFGLYLNFDKQVAEGEIMLGGIDTTKIVGGESALNEVPVEIKEDGMMITIDSISIGDSNVQTNVKALLDLSTNSFLAKKDLVATLNNALQTTTDAPGNEGLWKFTDCDKARNAPRIVMTINKVQYIFDPTDYVLQQNVGKSPAKSSQCFSIFNYKASLVDYDLILGTPFFETYYAVFDITNKKISFAKRIP